MFTQRKQALLKENNELSLQLDSAIKDYQQLADSDPALLRLMIPSDEIWRFFVDGDRQRKEDWRGFERREPGYLSALYKGFQEIFDFSVDIDINFFKKLHRIATTGVQKTNYALLKRDSELGEFRTKMYCAGSSLSSESISVDGIIEVLQSKNPYLAFAIWFPDTDQFDSSIFLDFVINKHSLQEIRNFVALHPNPDIKTLLTQLQHFCDKELLKSIDSFMDLTKEAFVEKILALGKTTTTAEAAQCLFDMISKEDEFLYLIISKQPVAKAKEALTCELRRLLRVYYHEMHYATTPLEKIFAIVCLVHGCDQLHPFRDANTRTFCMLVLPHLLMRNGFPPPILLNPNRFDACSANELMHETIHGMVDLFKLIKEKELHGITVKHILQQLQSTSTQPDNLLHYFKQTVAIEVQARKSSTKKRKVP